ncbi:hypothetical protein CLOM_g17285 [Closterium sp. NIES-68]|nr:hypothetical protein CLOM_g17285 [Closterium sp. NIES-68]GJP79110.1 hypothetical protein CLOP_g9352 [Closterium sp. NIES-67]
MAPSLRASRATLVCLSLNLTLCTVFNGRYYTAPSTSYHTAPVNVASSTKRGGSSNSGADTAGQTAGFVLPSSARSCDAEERSYAAAGLLSSLEELSWSPCLCDWEARLIASVPAQPVRERHGYQSLTIRPACVAPFIRKATKLYRLQQPPVPALNDSSTSVFTGRGGRERGDSRALEGVRCEESSVGRLRQLESTELCGLLLLGDGPPGVAARAQRDGSEESKRGEEQEKKRGMGRMGESSKGAKAEDAAKGKGRRGKAGKEQQQQDGGRAEVTSKQREMVKQANDEMARGRYKEAIAIYNKLASIPSLRDQVLLGRGSCLNALGQLDKALADLSTAVAAYPMRTDILMARAGTYFKMGKTVEAIVDYSRVIDLDPSNAEAVRWRAILSFNLKYFLAAEKDFQQAIHLDPSLPFVFRGLGLAIGGSGRWRESLAVFAEGVRRHPQDADLWHTKGRAHKEVGDVEQAIQALLRALQIRKSVATYQELVAVSRFLGDYRAAVRYAREGLELDGGDVELAHALASSLHALGDHSQAMLKYQAALALQPRDKEGQDLLHSMFYQREALAYTVSHLQQPLSAIRFDQHSTAEFREAWTKKDPPATLPGYRPLSVAAHQLQRATLQSLPKLPREALDLIKAADEIGKRAHYHCDAFMANRQQLRMAGLAALDVMQQARATWDAMEREQQGEEEQQLEEEQQGEEEAEGGTAAAGDAITSEADGGGGGGGGRGGGGEEGTSRAKQRQRGSDSRGTGRGKSSRGSKGAGSGLLGGWRDVYDVITRWRQVADPTDAVLWKDQLRNRFAQGFRSTTPIKVWDLQTVKYYPIFNKSFEAVRGALLESEQAFQGQYRPFAVPRSTRGDLIARASDLQAMHQAVGKDFLVRAPCYSHAVPGKDLIGSEFEILKTTHSFDFYTHTPVSPQRWRDFDHELAAAWQALCAAVLDARTEAADPRLYRQRIQHSILRLGFQLMPLTRGSAMAGLVSILGLSMAADMETTTLIPHGVQVDWEALLVSRLEDFHGSIAPWLFSSTQSSPWHLARVEDVLPTTHHVIAALSYES